VPVMLDHLVTYHGERYKVAKVNRGPRTWVLQSWAGKTVEVPDDDPNLEGLCEPISDWIPLPVPKVHQGKGPIQSLVKTLSVYPITLTPYLEWFTQCTRGPHRVLYIRPDSGIDAFEPLLVTFTSGKVVKLVTHIKFGFTKACERPTVVRRCRTMK
jgi:hypothetical protein